MQKMLAWDAEERIDVESALAEARDILAQVKAQASLPSRGSKRKADAGAGGAGGKQTGGSGSAGEQSADTTCNGLKLEAQDNEAVYQQYLKQLEFDQVGLWQPPSKKAKMGPASAQLTVQCVGLACEGGEQGGAFRESGGDGGAETPDKTAVPGGNVACDARDIRDGAFRAGAMGNAITPGCGSRQYYTDCVQIDYGALWQAPSKNAEMGPGIVQLALQCLEVPYQAGEWGDLFRVAGGDGGAETLDKTIVPGAYAACHAGDDCNGALGADANNKTVVPGGSVANGGEDDHHCDIGVETPDKAITSSDKAACEGANVGPHAESGTSSDNTDTVSDELAGSAAENRGSKGSARQQQPFAFYYGSGVLSADSIGAKRKASRDDSEQQAIEARVGCGSGSRAGTVAGKAAPESNLGGQPAKKRARVVPPRGAAHDGSGSTIVITSAENCIRENGVTGC